LIQGRDTDSAWITTLLGEVCYLSALITELQFEHRADRRAIAAALKAVAADYQRVSGRLSFTEQEADRNARGAQVKLGKFGHHPDPAIDFCVEVDALTGMAHDVHCGLANETEYVVRLDRALAFNVGGDPHAVAAKANLRELDHSGREES
jgi:hypothetical protein